MPSYLLLVILLHSPLDGPGDKELEEIPKQAAAAREYLRRELQQESLWIMDPENDAGNRRLLKLLGAVGDLKAADVAPILAREIAYDSMPRGLTFDRKRTYPAFRALNRLGLAGVHAVLVELKSFDVPEHIPITKQFKDTKTREELNELEKQRRAEASRLYYATKQDLLVECLVKIYDEGGFGATMARQRLEYEAAKATGKEKQRLAQALKHPALNQAGR